MAKPIKETPILTGKDASNFMENMRSAKGKKISPAELSRMKENFRKIESLKTK